MGRVVLGATIKKRLTEVRGGTCLQNGPEAAHSSNAQTAQTSRHISAQLHQQTFVENVSIDANLLRDDSGTNFPKSHGVLLLIQGFASL